MNERSRSFVDPPASIEQGLRAFIGTPNPDELMISGHFFGPEARLVSLQIMAWVRERLG